MSTRTTGHYETSIAGGESVRAFVPQPLPPQPPLELSGKRLQLLEQATLAVGRLDSVSMLLPDPQLFLYAYVRREAVLSSQIEGTQSSLSDLLLFEADEAPGVPLNDVQEVSNYVAALEHGMARLRAGFPLCNRLLCEMHEQLMRKGRGSDKQPGEFRRSQNWIGGTRPANAHFVPPPPPQLAACMSALEVFLHANQSLHSESEPNPAPEQRHQPQSPAPVLPTLVRAALVHVQFETIHPFLDGNGRLGRLLIALLLHHEGLLSQPLLYLSLYFKQHRSTYYELLDRVRTQGDWETWLTFFLEGVASTANAAVRTAQNLTQHFAADIARISDSGSAAVSHSPLRVLAGLRAKPVSSIKQLAASSGLSYPSVAKALKSLEEAGVVHELTGRRRNRVFVYSHYLQQLNEGGEAL
ncbi:MAG: Fic family protein [Pseudomonadota bacterium]